MLCRTRFTPGIICEPFTSAKTFHFEWGASNGFFVDEVSRVQMVKRLSNLFNFISFSNLCTIRFVFQLSMRVEGQATLRFAIGMSAFIFFLFVHTVLSSFEQAPRTFYRPIHIAKLWVLAAFVWMNELWLLNVCCSFIEVVLRSDRELVIKRSFYWQNEKCRLHSCIRFAEHEREREESIFNQNINSLELDREQFICRHFHMWHVCECMLRWISDHF